MKKTEYETQQVGLLKPFAYILFLVLCVYIGCFLGYEKLYISKTEQALNTISENMHKTFPNGEYPPAQAIKEASIVPQELEQKNTKEYFWHHFFGGNMLVSGVKESNKPQYNVILNNLSKRKCKLLANKDWRDNKYFMGMNVHKYSIIAKDAIKEFSALERVLSPEKADELCTCHTGMYCSIVLVYE